jgi:1,4-alpha-glucan branching enzyme
MDLRRALRYIQSSGKVVIIPSSATHAYSPLWQLWPQALDLQIRVAMEHYSKTFGTVPAGYWLPECGFFPGLDTLLAQAGVRYFFLDAHGILNGSPRPHYGVYAPVYCAGGAAAFGRDWASHDQVWLKDRGYPGDPAYLDFDRDIGFEREIEYLSPFTRHSGRVPTGIKYRRIGNGRGDELYDPALAASRCDAHAEHFVLRCQERARELHQRLDRKPVLVALFDTEHFGHWWREGPRWLDLMIRKMSYDQQDIKLVTAADYLESNACHQIVAPSMSSWGYQGYSETWLMGRNHWIYPAMFEAIELLEKLIDNRLAADMRRRAAIDQYLRELMLAQSSDWAFMMHAENAGRYPEQRVQEHLHNMLGIYDQVSQGRIEDDWIQGLKAKHNLFSSLDLVDIYLRCSRTI